jgi:hypothetical protein
MDYVNFILPYHAGKAQGITPVGEWVVAGKRLGDMLGAHLLQLRYHRPAAGGDQRFSTGLYDCPRYLYRSAFNPAAS